MNKIKNYISKKFVKPNVIETFTVDNEVYKVIDYKSPLPFIKNRRNLSFKSENYIFSHSAIYLNPRHRFQPIFSIPQNVIATWGKSNVIKNALVLGCGGCSLPRFIALSYPKSKTIGVELSEKFIEIAEKYFLLDQISKNFQLIQGDAVEFVKNPEFANKEDVIYVDLFDKTKIIDDVFSEDFLHSLINRIDDKGIIIINALGETLEGLKDFLTKAALPVDLCFVLGKNDALFLVLTRCPDKRKLAELIVTFKHSKDFETLYMH